MRRRPAVWIALALPMSGCLGHADTQKMDAATQQFFAEAAAKQYEAIYDNAAPDLTTTISKDLFVGFMQRIDRRMGACQPPVKAFNYRFNATSSGYFATQGYTSACANGQLTLSVTTVLRGGVARIAGYNAQSPLLLTD